MNRKEFNGTIHHDFRIRGESAYMYYMRGWSIKTEPAGTIFVPGDVVHVPECLRVGLVVDETYPRVDEISRDIFATICARLRDYVDGRRIRQIEVYEGYFSRPDEPAPDVSLSETNAG